MIELIPLIANDINIRYIFFKICFADNMTEIFSILSENYEERETQSNKTVAVLLFLSEFIIKVYLIFGTIARWEVLID